MNESTPKNVNIKSTFHSVTNKGVELVELPQILMFCKIWGKLLQNKSVIWR